MNLARRSGAKSTDAINGSQLYAHNIVEVKIILTSSVGILGVGVTATVDGTGAIMKTLIRTLCK